MDEKRERVVRIIKTFILAVGILTVYVAIAVVLIQAFLDDLSSPT